MVYTQVAPSLGEDPSYTLVEMMLTYLIGKQSPSQGNITMFATRVSQSVSEDISTPYVSSLD